MVVSGAGAGAGLGKEVRQLQHLRRPLLDCIEARSYSRCDKRESMIMIGLTIIDSFICIISFFVCKRSGVLFRSV